MPQAAGKNIKFYLIERFGIIENLFEKNHLKEIIELNQEEVVKGQGLENMRLSTFSTGPSHPLKFLSWLFSLSTEKGG